MIYRKPHDKSANKSIKKLESQQPIKKDESTKFVAKPAPNMGKAPKIPVRDKQIPSSKTKTVPQKIQQLQKIVQKIQNTKGNEQMQKMLLQEIRGIKSQLKEIKTQIGMKETHRGYRQQQQEQQAEQDEQNIMNLGSINEKQSQFPLSNITHHHNIRNQNRNQEDNQQTAQQITQKGSIVNRPKLKSSIQPKQKKILLDVGKIQPYMKEFKLQIQSKVPQPLYFGYHKKSSKPVIIKYCQENKNMDFVIGMYERLWKNIVKAKSICINKVYDLNESLATNLMVLEQNKCGLEGIEMNPFQIAYQILNALQFFHECGYLYRNIHPSHVMLSYENNIVLIDLKKMRKFVDIKGKVIQLKGNEEDEELDQFVSNSRIKNSIQGRKDDLQCLGYLTLYMLEGKMPWNAQNMIQVRSKLLLNQIFGKYPNLLKYMVEVHKLPVHEVPNYSMLGQLLAQ